MWAKIIGEATDSLPQMNHELLNNFHKKHLDTLVKDLEGLFRQNVRVMSNHLGWPEGFFRYVRCRELSPDERFTMLRAKNRKTYEKRFHINKTNKKVFAFVFEYDGMTMELPVDLPYITNYSIMRDGTPYYPIFAITDRGGLCYTKDAVLLQVMRTKLIFKRGKPRKVKTDEGIVIRECPITAKINQSNKGRKDNPPILLHHLAKLGLVDTLKLYSVDDAISVVNVKEENEKFLHVSIGSNCWIKLRVSKMNIRAKRVLVSLFDIYDFYPNFDYERLFDKRYYIIVTGKWSNVTQDYEVHLMANAEEFINMNKTLIDDSSRELHASIGIVYKDLDDLMLFMFNSIDQLMVDHTQNRIDMFKKRIAGTDMIKHKLFEEINRRMFGIINARYTKQTPDIKKFMYSLDYRKAITHIKIFRRAPMIYSDNALATIGLRFTTLSSTEINGGNRGSKKTDIPAELLVVHPSYLAATSILTYPSSKPISTGSINGFIDIDEHGNILEPYYMDDLRDIYTHA